MAEDIQKRNEPEEEVRGDQRSRTIVRTGVIGIAANLLLVGFKTAVGLLSNSIAIVMDAVNNLTDAASSVITIIGAKLAGKEPDRKHPFGYGRVEYLSATVISVLVLYAGITALVESVKKIITPDVPDYSAVSLIIVGVAVLVKIGLGLYVRKTGVRVRSDALVNSGKDALLDAVISTATLAAAAVYLIFGLSLEAWLGALISLVIIKSGFGMLRETVSKLLGERADADAAKAIRETVSEFPEVLGVYDLVLHDYGPDQYSGSLHIEVKDVMNADELDRLIRNITVAVYRRNNVILTAVGVYSANTTDPEAISARNQVGEIVLNHPDVLQMHGFYYNESEKTIRFDLVVGFDAKDRKQVMESVSAEVQEAFPDYRLQIALDTDFTGELSDSYGSEKETGDR